MREIKTIIDTNGFVIEKTVLFEDDNPQHFVLIEGQRAVEYITKTQVVNGRNVEYLKPKWTGTEWIETATQEELNEAYPVLKIEPTAEETALKQIVAIKIENIKKDTMLASALKTIADLKIEITALKGGN